jgi:hypothetical protein
VRVGSMYILDSGEDVPRGAPLGRGNKKRKKKGSSRSPRITPGPVLGRIFCFFSFPFCSKTNVLKVYWCHGGSILRWRLLRAGRLGRDTLVSGRCAGKETKEAARVFYVLLVVLFRCITLYNCQHGWVECSEKQGPLCRGRTSQIGRS